MNRPALRVKACFGRGDHVLAGSNVSQCARALAKWTAVKRDLRACWSRRNRQLRNQWRNLMSLCASAAVCLRSLRLFLNREGRFRLRWWRGNFELRGGGGPGGGFPRRGLVLQRPFRPGGADS